MRTEATSTDQWPEGFPWSDEVFTDHAGAPVEHPAPQLMEWPLGSGKDFGRTPPECLPGFKIALLPVGNNVWVCPVCGLLSRWATGSA